MTASLYYDLTSSDKDFQQGIKAAAKHINSGGLVAFPTETVYGLGADALNSTAVKGIYDAKGRPGDNPLILHVANIDGFTEITDAPPRYAYDMANAFWPGPFTIVANKKPSLPHWVGTHPSRSTDTVGIRIPAHPVAIALIEACSRVIAAPSANKASKPSPTKAEHVLQDFPLSNNEIMVLDGGSVSVGLESTVVDITGHRPRILRPGAITREDIWEVTGIWTDEGKLDESTPRSPGQKYKHYAPQAPMTILSGSPENLASHIINNLTEKKTGIFMTAKTLALCTENLPANIVMITTGGEEDDVARNLFSALRKFDEMNVEAVFTEAVPEHGFGIAIMDRMKKAAEGRIVYV